MKYSINGIDQLTLTKPEYEWIKYQDTLLITWAHSIFGLSKTIKKIHQDDVYYWLKFDQLLSDYPILKLKKESVIKRFGLFVKNGLLKKTTETNHTGTYGYYSPTALWDDLFNTSHNTENSHPEKKPSENSHPEKNPGGSEKNPGGSEKNPGIPYTYNPISQNPPPLFSDTPSSSEVLQEEQEIIQWFNQIGVTCKKDELIELYYKHGHESIETIYKQWKHDSQNGKTPIGIGALVHRLRVQPRQLKPIDKNSVEYRSNLLIDTGISQRDKDNKEARLKRWKEYKYEFENLTEYELDILNELKANDSSSKFNSLEMYYYAFRDSGKTIDYDDTLNKTTVEDVVSV